MKSCGKITFFIVIGFILLIAVYMGARRWLFNNRAISHEIQGTTETAAIGSHAAYDYNRMLHLIEQAQEIKRSFYAQFDGGDSHAVREVDFKFVKELLADLYRERMRLDRHIREVRIRYHGAASKKVRSLRTYQRIVEQKAKDLEAILRYW
jgi:hypothetical protein